MVCGADGSIKLWNVETGHPTNLIVADSGLSLTCVDRASNGPWLAQGTTNHAVQIVQIPLVSELVNISLPLFKKGRFLSMTKEN